MRAEPTRRLSELPPYLFVKLNALKRRSQAAGLDIIDLGQGSPDLPSPAHVVEALRQAALEPWTHRYPQSEGMLKYRQAIADWYRRRFAVDLNPETEVLPLIGSKEGLNHLFLAFLNPDDRVLVPNPCYPVHYNGVVLAGGKVHPLPLKEENEFLPELKSIPDALAKNSKFLILNYPNNPTGAILPDTTLLKEALDFSRRHGCLVIYDNAYSELTFDGYQAPSILQLPQAKDCAVEFHSLSKTYSMAGWRLGFAVGNPGAIAALAKFKGFMDYGIPSFLQEAGITALNGPQDYIQNACAQYQTRRDALIQALQDIGWPASKPKATIYLWSRLPKEAAEMGSLAFAEKLILEQGVVVSPGIGFGSEGEGYVRFSLIESAERLKEAAHRIGKFLKAAALAAFLFVAASPAHSARPLITPAPEFPKEAAWVNSHPFTLQNLRGRRVILVAFANCFNIHSIRAFKRLNRWWDQYSLHGLMIVGIHTPDYDFDRDPVIIRQGLQHLGVRFPVVIDKARTLAKAYANEGWPAFYLVDYSGNLIHEQLGEKSFAALEREILQMLDRFRGYSPAKSYTIPKDPARELCGEVTRPVYLGARRGRGLQKIVSQRDRILSRALDGEVFSSGPWSLETDSLQLGGKSHQDWTSRLQLFYQGAQAHAVMGREGSRPVRVYIKQDGLWLHPGNAHADVQWDKEERSYVLVDASRLYDLTKNKSEGTHELLLFPTERGTRVYSFEFSDKCQTESARP